MMVIGHMPLAWTDPRLSRKGTSEWSRGDDDGQESSALGEAGRI